MRIEAEPEKLATARSTIPSPLKSPVIADSGCTAAERSAEPMAIDEVGTVTERTLTFEIPILSGFETVTRLVADAATSADEIVVVKRPELTNVVGRAFPFQLTMDWEVKPNPFTVRTNPDEPGTVVMGTSGAEIRGTGSGKDSSPIKSQPPETSLMSINPLTGS